jgi:hypothetical protein
MSRANDSAFPAPSVPTDAPYFGLTIREHFAGLAMQGLCCHTMDGGEPIPEVIADWAVKCADALIAELAKVRHD